MVSSTSAVLIGLGVAILFLNTPQAFPSTTGQLLADDYGKPTLDLTQLLGGWRTPIRCT